jgi:hypothetical protein
MANVGAARWVLSPVSGPAHFQNFLPRSHEGTKEHEEEKPMVLVCPSCSWLDSPNAKKNKNFFFVFLRAFVTSW